MTLVSLQMISLGTLLIFNGQTSPFPTAAAVKCISGAELKNRTDAYRRTYWDKTSLSKILPPPQDTRSCAQAARETHGDVNNRSLSPWRYHLNQDADRFPHEISFAECFCQGCIIRQHEELMYNSVPVFSELMVLRKTRCPSDPQQFVVKKDFIKVPVACTCVVPKYTK